MKENDVSKLPKWAQGRISLAERNAEYYKSKLVEVETGDTNVFIWNYPESTPLPRDTAIEFVLADGATINVRHDGDRGSLQIMTYGGGIAAFPRSSNVIDVKQVSL